MISLMKCVAVLPLHFINVCLLILCLPFIGLLFLMLQIIILIYIIIDYIAGSDGHNLF